ncbi:MAG: hypothetical protein VB137_02990 [Burkholderia sp.]
MTMENHGPLHLETGQPAAEAASRHTLGDDAQWRDLTAYLRHIENADAMLGVPCWIICVRGAGRPRLFLRRSCSGPVADSTAWT